MKTKTKQYRQGDVMIERVSQLPADFKAAPLEDGRVVLAHGEVTGHAHVFDGEEAQKFSAPEGDEFIRVTGQRFAIGLKVERRWRGQVMVRHPEHGLIEFATDDITDNGDTVTIRGKFGILKHDEHTAQGIPAGFYRGAQSDGTVRQREYSPEAIRNVRD